MAVRDWVNRFFGQIAEVSDLATASTSGALVPTNTVYVTIGAVTVLADARAFIGGEPGEGGYGTDLGWLPTTAGTPPTAVSLLVLADNHLRVLDRGGERWSVNAGHIVALDGHRRSGFVVVTTGREGLAVATPSPVQPPPAANWRTIHGITNLFGGWDAALAPYHVPIKW